jgi:hypothetical protein
VLTRRALMLSAAALPATQLAWAAPTVPLAQVPEHLELVIQAAEMKVAGRTPPGNQPQVEFAPAALAAFQRLAIKPRGFRLLRAALHGITTTTKGNIPRFAVDGAFTYVSTGARQAVIAFTLLYGIAGDRLRIEYASLAPVQATKPMVMLYLLPGSISEAELTPKPSSFEKTLGQIVERAYDLHHPPAFSSGDYLIAAAVFDWLPDSIPINLWISPNADQIDPPAGQNTVAYFGGWRIYLRRVNMDFAAAQTYYAKVAWSAPANALLLVSPIPPQRS